jgi:gamma-glutamylcyclotransferase (GGCT)/AIG2-like uncharacterized protein YtfP
MPTAALCFAYGSNLNRYQMSKRCPAARPFGRMRINDYTLVFDGVADIIHSPGHVVEGACYWITDECEAALDIYEGFPRLYVKRYLPVEVKHRDGSVTVEDCMFYTMETTRIRRPSTYYVETIRQGFKDWNIPRDTLNAALVIARRQPRTYPAVYNPDLWSQCGFDEAPDDQAKPYGQ